MFPSPENKVLSLSELTNGIAEVISKGFPGSVWVKAEVAKLNHYPESGHCYPALVEKEKGTIRAEMRSTIWANDFLRINQKFLQVTREPLKEGIQILFRAMVKYHPVYGLSLQISDIDPTYTLGEMAREKMETIDKLKKEGVFDANRKLSLPVLPQRIAIISVKTSKGFSDFMSILRGNQWGYTFACYLFPALLQGDKAVDSILGQLALIRQLSMHFDVVVIIRGGGGDVGLNCYDNYSLAREVAVFPIPVISGIGHSTNETVVEMVAGQNLITPTDVAYYILQQFHNFSVKLNEMSAAIYEYANGMIDQQTRRHGDLGRRLVMGTRLMLDKEKRRQGELGKELVMGTRFLLDRGTRGKGDLERRLVLGTKLMITRQGMLISQKEQQLHLLDPVNVLKRGYSITFSNGKVLRDAADVGPGDEVITSLFSGKIISIIKSKSK